MPADFTGLEPTGFKTELDKIAADGCTVVDRREA